MPEEPQVPQLPPAPEPAPQQQPQADEAIASDFVSIRDAASGLGYDMSSYDDDDSALRALVTKANESTQSAQLAQYGQRYVEHAADFEEFLKQQQAQQQQKATPQAPKFWEPPAWDPGWLSQVEVDQQSGRIVPRAGSGSPELVQRVERYLQFRKDQQEKFWGNPFEFIKPYVEHVVQERASNLTTQQLQQYQEATSARSFVEQNKQMLFVSDPAGNPVLDAVGRMQFSPEGKVFYGFVEQAHQWGMPIAAQQEYAMNQLRAHKATTGQNAGQQQSAGNAQMKKDFLMGAAAATHQPNAGGAVGANGSQNPNMPFRDRLRANLKAAGVTDADMMATY
jgi:hypothetical protein